MGKKEGEREGSGLGMEKPIKCKRYGLQAGQ